MMPSERLIHLERLNKLDQAGLLSKRVSVLANAEYKGRRITPLAKSPTNHRWTWWMVLPILGCLFIMANIGMVISSAYQKQSKAEQVLLQNKPKQVSVEGPKKQITFREK